MVTQPPSPTGGYRNAPTYAPPTPSTGPAVPSWNADWSNMLVVDLEELRLAKNSFDAAATRKLGLRTARSLAPRAPGTQY